MEMETAFANCKREGIWLCPFLQSGRHLKSISLWSRNLELKIESKAKFRLRITSHLNSLYSLIWPICYTQSEQLLISVFHLTVVIEFSSLWRN